jgi:hypothetical protein
MSMDRVLILNVGGVLQGGSWLSVPTERLRPNPRTVGGRREPRGAGGRRAARRRSRDLMAAKSAIGAAPDEMLPTAVVAIAFESLVGLAGEAGFLLEPESDRDAGAQQGMEFLCRMTGAGDFIAPVARGVGRVPYAMVRKTGASPFALLPMNSFLFLVTESERLRRLGGVA